MGLKWVLKNVTIALPSLCVTLIQEKLIIKWVHQKGTGVLLPHLRRLNDYEKLNISFSKQWPHNEGISHGKSQALYHSSPAILFRFVAIT